MKGNPSEKQTILVLFDTRTGVMASSVRDPQHRQCSRGSKCPQSATQTCARRNKKTISLSISLPQFLSISLNLSHARAASLGDTILSLGWTDDTGLSLGLAAGKGGYMWYLRNALPQHPGCLDVLGTARELHGGLEEAQECLWQQGGDCQDLAECHVHGPIA